jgi:uncharacterized phage protein (predicted DNA packaging)
MLTLQEVKDYLRVDFNEDDALISSLMTAADEYLKSSVGVEYDNTSERAKTLSLIVISDLYDNRGLSDKASANVRRLVEDFSLQLRLELRA